MIYVCGVLQDGVLYVIDTKFYTSLSFAKKRRNLLNKGTTYTKWTILYQDKWIPL